MTLGVYFIGQRCRGSKDVDGLTIGISSLIVIQGVANIVQVQAALPIVDKDFHEQTFLAAYFVNYLCQFGAQWYFTIKYYEAAKEFELMLESVGPNRSSYASQSKSQSHHTMS